uniref:Uncharacterized protein n=1 Tax=Salix viminalis TaxID=40686 RepID=A0A6N2NF23_SALVM
MNHFQVNLRTFYRTDLEFLSVHHHKVLDVMIIVHPLPLEGTRVIFSGYFMEDGIVVPLEGVIETVTLNLIGIQILEGVTLTDLGDLGKYLSMMDFLEVVLFQNLQHMLQGHQLLSFDLTINSSSIGIMSRINHLALIRQCLICVGKLMIHLMMKHLVLLNPQARTEQRRKEREELLLNQ